MKYLLDTDICIFFLKGKYKINEKIKSVGIYNCFISEITIAELKYGAEKSKNYLKHSKEVDKMKELFSVIPISNAIDKFAKEKVRLQKSGTLIPDFDILIGVAAITNNCKMVTNNVNHMKRIDGIEIENWSDSTYNEFIYKS